MAKRMTKKGVGEKAMGEKATPRASDYLDLGRTNQKMRTRDALVSAAVDVIRAGQPVTVADVADTARVSRTTAYRYFPTSEMLAAQATLAAFDQIEVRALEAIAAGPGTPQQKLERVITGTDAMTAGHEAAFRSLVRFTVEARGSNNSVIPRRPGFRRQWLDTALSSLRAELGHSRFERLTAALSMFCGIESFIVLNDICLMPHGEARDVKQWAGQLLLRAALAEAAEMGEGKRSKTREVAKPKSAPRPRGAGSNKI